MTETSNRGWLQLQNFAKTVIHEVGSTIGFRSDSWENPITGLGTARDKATRARVKQVIPIPDIDLENLFDGDDLARRIVTALPEAALRQGVILTNPTITDPTKLAEAQKRLNAELIRFGARDAIGMADTWGRLYGRGAILLGIEGAGMPEQPVTPGRGKLKWILVLDKRDFSPMDVDTTTNAVQTWVINSGSGNGISKVHTTRLILFGGAMTNARARLRMQYSDFSVLQTCIDQIRDLATVWGSSVSLVSDASQAVYKIKGFFDMLTQGNVDALMLRFGLIDAARSSVKAILLDAEDEDFERKPTQLTGVPELNEVGFKRLAASARMPVTVLMGMSPAGLNATGDNDIRSWYSEVDTHRVEIEPQVNTLINLIAVAAGLSPGWEVEWPSQWSMTPNEEAEFRKLVVETDSIQIADGILIAEEVAAHRQSGSPDAYLTPVPIDLEARKRAIEAAMSEVAPPPAPALPTPPAPRIPPIPSGGAPAASSSADLTGQGA